MRKGVTLALHLGTTFKTQEQLQQQHLHHQPYQLTPPSSGWKSPIPYLFGGLAAMLGLIAFALLILACSYWKLSGYQDNGAREDSGDATSDEKPPKDANNTAYLNSILVIMAGDDKPTFLAMPATSRVSFFGDTESSKASTSGDCDGDDDGGELEKEVKDTVVVPVDEDKRS